MASEVTRAEDGPPLLRTSSPSPVTLLSAMIPYTSSKPAWSALTEVGVHAAEASGS